jgi:uncharacterized protein (TIGR00303 family)
LLHSTIKSSDGNKETIARFASNSPIFVCVTSYTETSKIPGITIAGADANLIAFTPAADAEFLCYGRCKSISGVPATPDGIPTPALITRSALMKSQIPNLIVDAGSKIKPRVPAVSFGIRHGKNIMEERAMVRSDAEKGFEYGKILGIQLGMISDMVIVGETIPGGTTTALAVLTAFGIDAKYKVSSSMPNNPHQLKNKVVSIALNRLKDVSRLRTDPLDFVSRIGDPMIPSVAGIASGATSQGVKVILAGGTQMTAVLCLLNALKVSLEKICIGTTSYIESDESSDIHYLTNSISSSVPILSIELDLQSSKKEGLKKYTTGIAKEGVGAGGAAIAATLKSGPGHDSTSLLQFIEKEYESTIEKPKLTKSR